MTVYHLFDNLAAAQTIPAFSATAPKGGNLPTGSQAIDLSAGGALSPLAAPTNQQYSLTVDGASPGVTVSAAATFYGSNDGVRWLGLGSITVASGPSPGIGGLSVTTSPWAFYAGVLTAISGTSAKATALMNA